MTRSLSALAVPALALLHSVAIAQTSTYENPVDGKEYTAEWRTYEPDTPKNDLDARVSIENVVLLTSQQDLEKRVAVESLANYFEQFEADLLELATDYSDHGRVLLQVEIGQEATPVYQLAYEGSISTDLLQAYYEKITKNTDAPKVHGPVSFQLVLIVRDHSDLSIESTPE